MYIVMTKDGKIAGIFHRKKSAQKFFKTLNNSWKIERHYWYVIYKIMSWLYEKRRQANHRKYNRLVRKSRIAQKKLKNFRRMD